jgi:hypothetical protein
VAAGLETACLGAAAALALAGASVVTVVILAGAAGIAATAPRPALQTLMPAYADSPRTLTRATAVWSAVDNLGFLAGGGLGGIAIAVVGVGTVMAVSAALLFAAGLIALGLPSVTATSDDEVEPEEGVFAGALAGLRAVVHSRMLRGPFILFAGLLLLEGTTDVQLVALSLGRLRLGDGGPGLLYGIWGVGGVCGSFVILVLVRRRGYGLALSVGALSFGAGLALAGAGGIPIALGAMIAAGLGFALVETAVTGLVPRLADDRIVGRVYALSELLYAGAAGVGALIAPGLINTLGVSVSLAAVGITFAALAVVSLRSYAALDTGQQEAERVRDLLRGIRFLAPLPLPRLERLVRGARPVDIPAGTAVIRQGEPGHEFFVIERGDAEIIEYGRRQGPGEGFGEIALLQDVPRTASVRALTELRLWAITRSAFIAAVVGHGDARRLADAIVAEHLARPRVADLPGEPAALSES